MESTAEHKFYVYDSIKTRYMKTGHNAYALEAMNNHQLSELHSCLSGLFAIHSLLS